MNYWSENLNLTSCGLKLDEPSFARSQFPFIFRSKCKQLVKQLYSEIKKKQLYQLSVLTHKKTRCYCELDMIHY